MAEFTVYNGSDNTALTNALLAPGSGIAVSNIVLKASGQDAVNFYDGSLNLGIGSGLLLTSGTTPGTSNTVGWFGTDNSIWPDTYYNGDADIDAVVNTVFATQSYDATTLSFDFTVADTTATSVSFDVVFGSDEFPEWVDQFVDCAIVMVNGVNYALFNHDAMHPLSVVSSNLAAGYFQDNAPDPVTGLSPLPIEYDGVSHVLKIVAPINSGAEVVNHIKIGIADTGDHIYDSGIFIANLSAGNIPGSGVVSTPTTGTGAADSLTGTAQAEYFDLQGGNDTCYAGAGDDIVVAGSGDDSVYGGSGADELKGDVGDDYLDGGADADTAVFAGASTNYFVAAVGSGFTITDKNAVEGTDTLTNVEFAKFSDGLFALTAGGLTPVTPVTPPSNTPGSVVISGIAMAGKTLTAIVTDADGIASPATIIYQWQSFDGSGWNNIDNATKTYLLRSADIGKQVQVIASYSDATGVSETPISAAVTIAQATSGFSIDPMVITAPVGASVMDPLTTLIKNAVDFGYTPNEASLAVKSVLLDGIIASSININLATYDAYAVLLTSPSDPTAVAFLKVAAQVAMTASVSDPSGMNMMLAVMNAAAAGKTLDLTNATDLVTAGVDPTVDPVTGNSPLTVVQNLNKNMAEDPNDLGGIEIAWNDWAGKQDSLKPFLDHLGLISVHINQAPTGSADAILANGTEASTYLVSSNDLLSGFSDPEGGVLSVSNLTADHGSVTAGVGVGDFSITLDVGYSGPVELSYNVADDQGLTAPATQLFVVTPNSVTPPPVNHAPTGAATAVLAAGTEDIAYAVTASALLTGFSDVDAGDTLSVSGLIASDGTVADNGDGTFTITLTANYNGPVTLTYDVTDSLDSIAATQSFDVAAVNDAPTGAPTAILAAGSEDTAYNVSAAMLLAGFSDVDGDPLSVADLSASNGVVTGDNIVGFTITPTANYNGAVSLSYNVVDGNGGSVGATQNYDLAAVNDAPTGSVTITGTPTQGQTLTAGNTLADADGLGTISYQWLSNGAAISGATGDTLVLGQGEVGTAISVAASYNDLMGTSESVTSPATANVAAPAGVTLTGNSKANLLTGSAYDDTLSGLGGNDTLNGMAGNDTLLGGSGNDTYIVDSAGDVVTEAAGAGTDLVQASVSYTLGANVEKLTLTGAAAIDATGNALANTLTGNSGNNVLDGKAGSDTMVGGAGDDTYYVDATGDVVTEATGAGNDTIHSSLAAYTLAANVENLILDGSAANGTGNTIANTLFGNAAANVLSGLAGNDLLNGGAGSDTLIGGAGNDSLTGGDGADIFRFDNTALNATTNVDTINVFNPIDDTIQLENAVFKKLTATGTLSTANFRASIDGTAGNTNQFVLYDTDSGALYYDADGSGAGAAVQFATLIGVPTVTAADFVVI